MGPIRQLLLYDREPITQHIAQSVFINGWLVKPHLSQLSITTKAICIPLYMMIDQKPVTRDHTRLGRTLSEQLCRRVFFGADLHYDDATIRRLTGFARGHHPQFVAKLLVTHGDTDITQEDDINGINTNLYRIIE